MQTHIKQPSTDQMQDKELMRLLGLGGSAASSIIRLASSKNDLKELLPVLNSACSGLSFCQVFDPLAIIDEAHLQLAYLNAKAAFEEDRNMSKSMQIEMLLFAAMTRQINEAIRIAGAKSSKKMLLFCSDKKTFDKIKPNFYAFEEFRPSPAHSKSAMAALGIKSKEQMSNAIALTGLQV